MNDCIADTKNTIGIIDNLKTSKNLGLIESIDFYFFFYIAKVAANKEFNNNTMKIVFENKNTQSRQPKNDSKN